MRGILRISTVLLLISVCFFMMRLPCSADTDDPLQAMQERLYALDIPQDADDALRDLDVDPADPAGITALSPGSVWQRLRQTIAEEAAAPLRLCGMLLSLTVLTALLGGLSDAAAGDTLRPQYDTVCTLICVCTAVKPVCTCLLRTADALSDGQVFMAGFVPVFAAFLAAGGSVAGSSTYQVFVLFLTEGFMQLTNAVLFPLLQMGTAAGIADAIAPKMKLGRLADGFRTAVTWLLGTVTALFSAMLSVRSFVASAADTLASKSVRLLTAGIPIVGSAVSEAYSTVQGSIRLLRNGTGAVGVLVILWLTLPPLLSLLIYRAVFGLMQLLSELAGAESLAKLYKNMQTVLSAAFAMLICDAVMLTVSGALMILLTGAQ